MTYARQLHFFTTAHSWHLQSDLSLTAQGSVSADLVTSFSPGPGTWVSTPLSSREEHLWLSPQRVSLLVAPGHFLPLTTPDFINHPVRPSCFNLSHLLRVTGYYSHHSHAGTAGRCVCAHTHGCAHMHSQPNLLAKATWGGPHAPGSLSLEEGADCQEEGTLGD